MPFDRNNNKPLLPRVAANAKSPVTPRLAAQHLRASKSRGTLVTSPPPDNPKLNGRRSPIVKDDITTPVKSLLSSNITPRSSSRKSRIEGSSNQSTPTATPVHIPVQDVANRGIRVTSGSTIVSQAPKSTHKRPGSVVLDASAVPRSPLVRATTFAATSGSGHSSPRDANSFFHASNVKNTEAAPQLKKAATFFYANGQTEEPQEISRAPSPPLSTISTKSSKSQFFHANGQPDLSNAPPLPISPITNPSPEPRPTVARTNSSTSSSFAIRPTSPQKSNFHLTYRKGVSQILSPKTRAAAMLPPVAQEPISPKRLSSTDSASVPTSRSHTRTGSLNSIDTSGSSRKSSIASLDTQLRQSLHANGIPTSAPAVQRIPPPPTSNPLQLDLSQDLRPPTSNPLNSSPSATFSLPQSPSHNSNPQQGSFAEAAANARRERKVLDLEISNSSLLAINRQLEREVRRQKSELRRFRRLSRAGRLSSLGSVMHELQEDDEEFSDSDAEGPKKMTWSDDEFSDLDEEEDPDSSMSDESFTSSQSLSQRQVARLAKDEKRLKVDLERHRQLLIDSQKMNQSLKKCMAWSEEMIEEAKRALNYQVRVSDIKLGGRVLDHDDIKLVTIPEGESPSSIEEEEHAEQRNGLLGTWSPPESTTPLAALMNATDGLLGLAVNLSQEQTNMPDEPETSTGGERDSGVHVDDAAQISAKLGAEDGLQHHIHHISMPPAS